MTTAENQYIKLESIFLPHARKHRDDLYKSNEYVKFVHYTSAEAALNIIKSKRFWMRNTNCMADYKEVHHGYEILHKYFDSTKTKIFTDALDKCAAGAATEAITLFNQWLGNIKYNTYITSISEHDDTEDLHGRLSMWRAFGGNTARVAIVLNVPWDSSGAEELKLIFSPVAYLKEDEVHNVMDEVINNIKVDCDFLSSLDPKIVTENVFHMLLAGVTCLKHKGFKEEREWRAIYNPDFRPPSLLMESSTEIIGGVPQNIYKIPLDVTVSESLADLEFSRIFDRVIIGPTPYSHVMHKAFSDTLTNAGVSHADTKVFVSDIPIRS